MESWWTTQKHAHSDPPSSQPLVLRELSAWNNSKSKEKPHSDMQQTLFLNLKDISHGGMGIGGLGPEMGRIRAVRRGLKGLCAQDELPVFIHTQGSLRSLIES